MMVSSRSSRRLSLKIVRFLIMLAFPLSVRANLILNNSTHDSPWLTFGLGGATHRLAASVNVSFSITFHLLSAHLIYMTDYSIGIPAPQSASSPQHDDKDVEYAILYGVHKQGDFGLASISAGISVNQAMHNPPFSTYKRENVVSVGMPIEVQLAFGAGHPLRYGFTYFANFNNHYSYNGGSFSIL